MSLNHWQERLHKHFGELKDRRLGLQGGQGVLYALEHGLAHDEVAQLKSDIHDWLKSTGLAKRHFLAWVVYASEVGYEYSGEEYWTTFSSRTPNWQDSSYQRDQIREAFREFHRQFSGAKPHGPWADQFTIICWPITNAILPQDLQRELARILYDLRGSFTPGMLHSPELLGQRIEDASWNSRARFRQLAEDHVLVGQISAALLLNDDEKDRALILPSTLDRIAADLDRNQRSREWLRDARTRATQVRLRGLSRASVGDHEIVSASGAVLTAHQRQILELGIEPDLFLRRTGPKEWSVALELQSLTPLVQRFPRLKDVVANQRCTVSGSKGGPLPRGYLLWGSQTITLSRWPASEEVLLKFENRDAELDYLLRMECLLRSGPTWLFKISPDGGIATHIKTGMVQPGYSYIVVGRSSDNTLSLPLHARSVTVDCEGITAREVEIPEVVSRIYEEQLQDLSLQLSSQVQVVPFGTPTTRWEETGLAEWLSSDRPLIAISANFEVEGLLLNLVGPASNRLEISGPIEWPLLLDLEKLDPGLYNLHVLVFRSTDVKPLFGRLQFTVREPKLWNSAAAAATPFSARVSPALPTLEEIWEGRASIELTGPKSRTADVTLTFFSSASASSIHQQTFGSLRLPCSPTEWAEHWSAFTGNKSMQNAYDASSECELTITCEELGRFSLRASRAPRPVRWVVKQGNSGYHLRLALLNDQILPSVTRYAFRSPAEFASISDDAMAGFRVSEEGGLFAAISEKDRDSVIVPPAIHSFKWLSAEVPIPQMSASETSIGQLLAALELWSQARTVGNPFAISRKNAAIESLQKELVRMLCGNDWSKQESKQKQRHMLADFKGLVSHHQKHSYLIRDLFLKEESLRLLSLDEIIDILDRLARSHLDLQVFSTARDHGMSRQRWLIEFTYRMWLNPESIRTWAASDFMPAVGYVLKNGTLARFIRVAYLMSNMESHEKQHMVANR